MPSVTNANNASICCGMPPERPRHHRQLVPRRGDRPRGVHGGCQAPAGPDTVRAGGGPGGRLGPAVEQEEDGQAAHGAADPGHRGRGARRRRPSSVTAPPRRSTAPRSTTGSGRSPSTCSRPGPTWACLYVHTTDYPMHMRPPERHESKAHLARIDARLAEAARPPRPTRPSRHRRPRPEPQVPGLGPRQGVRAAGACRCGWRSRRRRTATRSTIAASAAPPGSTSTRPTIPAAPTEILRGLEGVEAVLPRAEAAERLDLLPSRIGDLVVTGDKQTVFGEPGRRVRRPPRRVPLPRLRPRDRSPHHRPQRGDDARARLAQIQLGKLPGSFIREVERIRPA